MESRELVLFSARGRESLPDCWQPAWKVLRPSPTARLDAGLSDDEIVGQCADAASWV